jgi:hypothetical protein
MLLHFSSPAYTAKHVAAAELTVRERRAATFSRKMKEVKGTSLDDSSVAVVSADCVQNLSLPFILL